MNKLLLFGLLAILFNSVAPLECTSWPSLGVSPNDLDEDHCAMLTPKSSGDTEEYTHCCRFEVGDNDNYYCHGVTDDQYENIGRYKKYLEDSTGNDYDIDCSSKFVTFSLFALLALLF